MMSFGERLAEEMSSSNTNVEELSKKICVSKTIIYEWLNNNKLPSLFNVIKIADLFSCSIDYLFDKESRYENATFYTCPDFATHFAKLVKQKSNLNAISKATGVSRSRLYSWIKGSEPRIDNLIKVADHLKITVDVLVGRQKL